MNGVEHGVAERPSATRTAGSRRRGRAAWRRSAGPGGGCSRTPPGHAAPGRRSRRPARRSSWRGPQLGRRWWCGRSGTGTARRPASQRRRAWPCGGRVRLHARAGATGVLPRRRDAPCRSRSWRHYWRRPRRAARLPALARVAGRVWRRRARAGRRAGGDRGRRGRSGGRPGRRRRRAVAAAPPAVKAPPRPTSCRLHGPPARRTSSAPAIGAAMNAGGAGLVTRRRRARASRRAAGRPDRVGGAAGYRYAAVDQR